MKVVEMKEYITELWSAQLFIFNDFIKMTNLLLYFVALATVITSIVNFLKPAYKKFAGRFNATINIAVSFILGVLASFSVAPYLGLELNTGMLILLGLALGTGSNIFYDLWNIVKGIGERLNNLSKKE